MNSYQENEKSKSKSVSLYPSEWEFVEKQTKESFSDRSEFFRDAINFRYKETDLPERNSPELVLEELAKKFKPSMYKQVKALCFSRKINQPSIVEAIVASLPDLLSSIQEGEIPVLFDIIPRNMISKEYVYKYHARLVPVDEPAENKNEKGTA